MVDVVLINWNSGNDLKECLQSIIESCDSELISNIYVIDNNSHDGSMSNLPSRDYIKTISNDINQGFAYACNQGAALGNSPYILFLNVDIVVRDGSIREPLRFMEHSDHGDVGICGITLVGSDNCIQPTVARFPSAMAMFGHATGLDKLNIPGFAPHFLPVSELDRTQPVDQVMGAFFLVRRAVFDELGGFDERYFVFYEELDFAFRARKAGWKSIYLSSSYAMHDSEVVRSTPFRIYLAWRGRIIFAWKHFSVAGAILVSLSTLFIEPFVRLLVALATGSSISAKVAMGAARFAWGELPGIFYGRISRRPKIISAED